MTMSISVSAMNRFKDLTKNALVSTVVVGTAFLGKKFFVKKENPLMNAINHSLNKEVKGVFNHENPNVQEFGRLIKNLCGDKNKKSILDRMQSIEEQVANLVKKSSEVVSKVCTDKDSKVPSVKRKIGNGTLNCVLELDKEVNDLKEKIKALTEKNENLNLNNVFLKKKVVGQDESICFIVSMITDQENRMLQMNKDIELFSKKEETQLVENKTENNDGNQKKKVLFHKRQSTFTEDTLKKINKLIDEQQLENNE